MEAKTKDLWVFVETKEDGSAKNVGIELLAPGRNIADKQGGSLVALVVGCGVDSAVEECAAHGADKVVVVDGEEFRDYSTDAYAAALAALIEKYGPASVLIGATPNGRRAYEPINHGANPHPGFRKDGALTAMTNSICAIQPGYGNTAPVQLELDPGRGRGEEEIGGSEIPAASRHLGGERRRRRKAASVSGTPQGPGRKRILSYSGIFCFRNG